MLQIHIVQYIRWPAGAVLVRFLLMLLISVFAQLWGVRVTLETHIITIFYSE